MIHPNHCTHSCFHTRSGQARATSGTAAGPSGSSGGLPAAGDATTSAPPPVAPAQPAKVTVKVTAQKFNYMQNQLVLRMMVGMLVWDGGDALIDAEMHRHVGVGVGVVLEILLGEACESAGMQPCRIYYFAFQTINISVAVGLCLQLPGGREFQPACANLPPSWCLCQHSRSSEKKEIVDQRTDYLCLLVYIQEADGDATEEEGIKQADLMSWYMEEQTRKGLLESEAQAEEEMHLLLKVGMETHAHTLDM
eukprot:scaffold32623_cov20-Tisochrysis_lutea.AAC.1